jgi:hypothetical protein
MRSSVRVRCYVGDTTLPHHDQDGFCRGADQARRLFERPTVLLLADQLKGNPSSAHRVLTGRRGGERMSALLQGLQVVAFLLAEPGADIAEVDPVTGV